MPLVIAFACLAALLFAVSASLQQRAAAHVHRSPAPVNRINTAIPVVRLLHGLLRQPIWLIGWVVNLGGFMVQAAALHLGSVEVVQPVLVLQLLFTLPLTALNRRQHVGPRDWAAAMLICAGVALFLADRGPIEQTGDADRSRVLLCVVAATMVILGLVRAATTCPPAVHATLVAIGAGLCFALSAVLMKLTTEDLLERGVGATAVDWPGYLLAVTTAVGLLLGQDAYATGSLAAAVAAMTITNPFASYVMGTLSFHTPIDADAGSLASVAGAGALLVLGVIGLSHSPLVRSRAAAAPSPALL